MNLLKLPAIGAAISLTTTSPVRFNAPPRNLTIQSSFTYGSGGTAVDAWVQTSLDQGATWIDIAQFHWAQTSGRSAVNLSGATAGAWTPTDGTMAANNSLTGVLGPLFRVKYSTSGTYGGATSLSIDIAADQAGIF